MKMKYFFLSVFLITSFSFVVLNAKLSSRYVVLWRNVSCHFNPKYVHHLSCDIIQPEQQYISSYLIYAVDINPGYMVNARFDVLRSNGQVMNILKMDVDVCEFFSKEHDNNLIKLARQSFDEHGNYTQCPLYKDVAFGLFNWTFDVSKVPYTPEMDFIINLRFLLPQNIETLRLNITGSLELRRKRPLRVLV